MKKLMLTTAIASVLTTAAIAQTTITGELRLNLKTQSTDKGINPRAATAGLIQTATTTPDTAYGFGAEQQINIQTKGKLNVGGLDYAAGFSLENDGEQTTTLFNENVYMDLTYASSGTTVSFGRDHIQRSDSDFSATNLVGFTPNELSQTSSKTNIGTSFAQKIGAAPGQAYGAAIIQATPIGRFSYNWVPNNGKVADGTSTADQVNLGESSGFANNAASEYVNPNTTSASEYGFVGDLTVKGLQVHYFKNKNDDFVDATKVKQAEGKNYGVRYNFGQFTVGANKKVYNAEGAANVAEISEKAYAAAYAITPTLSIGVIKATADRSNTADAVEQTMKAINIGYALGPVDLSVGYANNENGANVNGADSDVFMARLIGKF
jgi:hypothetical protein